jgi:hypothetical protein
VREFVIDRLVPRYGLPRFVTALEKSTGVRLPDVPSRKDSHLYPQIAVAFEIRHLAEHRDGKIDGQFQAHLRGLWVNSSWGARQNLEHLEKVVIEQATAS